MLEKTNPYTQEFLADRRRRKETIRNRRSALYGALGAAAVVGSLYLFGGKATDKPSNPENTKSTKEITIGPGGQFPSLAGAVIDIVKLNPNLKAESIRENLAPQNHLDPFHPDTDETLNVPNNLKIK